MFTDVLDWWKVSLLYSQLKAVVEQVDSLPQNELQPPIGVLTSEHRETWAKVKIMA